MKEKNPKNTKIDWVNFISLTIAIVAFIFAFVTPYLVKIIAISISNKYGFEEATKYAAYYGTIGDWFGGTTLALFSITSVLLFFVTLRMQKQELFLQREELEATKNEFIQQNETMRLQRFENTFFNMISLHNEIVRSLEDNVTSRKYKGRETFFAYYRYLKDRVRQYEMDENKIIEKYEDLFKILEHNLGHYFRNIYRIVKLIDLTPISFDEKKVYIGILKAQLTSYEIVMLFYNGISRYGNEKFLPLIKKYNLLDNINEELIINKEQFVKNIKDN